MQLKIRKTDENVELNEFIEAKRAVEDAQRRLELAQQSLVEKMTREQRKTFIKEDGGKVYRATYVQAVRTVVNEEGLKKAIGAVKFRKVSKQVLDKKLLEKAMETGAVDPVLVGQYVTEVPNRPSIRLSEGTASDERSDTEAAE
jgi:hypothetical protein